MSVRCNQHVGLSGERAMMSRGERQGCEASWKTQNLKRVLGHDVAAHGSRLLIGFRRRRFTEATIVTCRDLVSSALWKYERGETRRLAFLLCECEATSTSTSTFSFANDSHLKSRILTHDSKHPEYTFLTLTWPSFDRREHHFQL